MCASDCMAGGKVVTEKGQKKLSFWEGTVSPKNGNICFVNGPEGDIRYERYSYLLWNLKAEII